MEENASVSETETKSEEAEPKQLKLPTISVEDEKSPLSKSQFSTESSRLSRQNSIQEEDLDMEEEDELDLQSAVIKRRMTMPASTLDFRKTLREEANMGNAAAEELESRLKSLVLAFSTRTKRIKAKIEKPPTPSISGSDDEAPEQEDNLLERLRDLYSPCGSQFGGDSKRKSISERVRGSCSRKLRMLMNFFTCHYILDADGRIYVTWLSVVAVCFLYNAVAVPLRSVFPYQTKQNVHIWQYLDHFVDVVYVIDIIAFKSHRKFLREGFWIKDPKQTRESYFKTTQFKIDVAALFPADILVLMTYGNYPLLRIPRLLKLDTYWELFQRFDTILASPHSARITKTCIYMLYMIHVNACVYYGLSLLEGIGSTTWTFDGTGNAYIKCFYFATKTATSIGKMPRPDNEMEYMYMTFAWLSGVFVFAILIGQIRDIIGTATKNQEDFRAMTHNAISYLNRLGVNKKLQNKVKLWLSYTWEQQKTLDESKILDLLPDKMRTDVALDLHVETLSKVKLFHNCEVPFLRDLVVKLKSIIFLPGDYICKKGDVGREMYIIKSGKINVVGGPTGTQILVTLGEGSVFGEIALLGVGGMNKRTADVRAAGFANLFVLHKEGLQEAIRDYPASQEIIKKKAKKLMKDNMKKAKAAALAAAAAKESEGGSLSSTDTVSVFGDDVIIKNKANPPKLIGAMKQIFHPESKIGQYLTLGLKAATENDIFDKSLDVMTLTSYPPSPYVPGSPNHISLELDISIMTGDSSEGQLSPPPRSLSQNSQSPVDLSLMYSSKFRRQLELEAEGQDRRLASGNASRSGTSSAEELRAYLDNDDFEAEQSLEGTFRCSTPIPPLSPTSLETGDFSVTKLSKIGPTSSSTVHSRRTRATPIPIPTSDDVQMQPVDYEDEARSFGQGNKNDTTDLKLTMPHLKSKREKLPVALRPPIYPILPGAYGETSLSSSEESEDPEGFGNKGKQRGKEMTPRVAALIASRFLTAMKGRVTVPLKRQKGFDKQQSGESVEEEKETGGQEPSLDYDSD